MNLGLSQQPKYSAAATPGHSTPRSDQMRLGRSPTSASVVTSALHSASKRPPRQQPNSSASTVTINTFDDADLRFKTEDDHHRHLRGTQNMFDDDESEDGGFSNALRGTKVYSFDSAVAREMRKRKRAFGTDAPQVPLKNITARENSSGSTFSPSLSLKKSTPTSTAKKSVAFSRVLVGSATPSKSAAGSLRGTPIKGALRCSSSVLPAISEFGDSDAALTPKKRGRPRKSDEGHHSQEKTPKQPTRVLTKDTTPAVATRISTARTPKGRTPDARLQAATRIEETLGEESETDISSSDDNDDEEDDKSDEWTHDELESRQRGSPVQKKQTLAKTNTKRSESDFDRDVKRRGKTRAQVEDYFVEKNKKKNFTSDHTLSGLPILTRKEFLEAVERFAVKHNVERQQLAHLIPSHFSQWEFEMNQGFNLLLYGYGSKRKILEQFKEKVCTTAPVLIVNGFIPTFNFAADVLSKIASSLLDQPAKGKTKTQNSNATKSFLLGTAQSHISNIAKYFWNANRAYDHLFILINSIDAPAVRTNLSNYLHLTELIRACPKSTIRVIATVDHINAPLLWDRPASDTMRWLWKDATTYDEYFAETGHAAIVMVEAGGYGALSSNRGVGGAGHVLRSLNGNARRMFKILADAQMAEEDVSITGSLEGVASDSDDEDGDFPKIKSRKTRNPKRGKHDKSSSHGVSVGMPYNLFLGKCLESFCVNGLDNFKAQLAEFRDHKIILSKRGNRGEDILYIPFDKAAIMTTSGSHTVARLEAALHSASSANSDPAARCIAVNRIAADIVALRHVDTFPGGSNPEAGELARVEALAQMILGQINADVTALLTVAADRKRQTVNYKSGRFNLTAFKAAPWVYLRSARQTLKEKENEAGREEPSAKEQFKHYSDSKAELLRTVPTASNRETVHDDDAFLLKEQRRLQEEYSADLARMAERLKDNSLMFTDALKADKEVCFGEHPKRPGS
ncbi:Origin recognition complex subunit 2 [Entophlyctis luteolus]|nr:Origin recognition complex subunit 2 [Entophlyctis luteolus]